MNKKLLGIMLCLLLVFTSLLVISCGNEPDNTETNTQTNTSTSTNTNTNTNTSTQKPDPVDLTVTFIFDNGTEDKVITVKEGEQIKQYAIPDDPQKDGYKFDGWYLGNEMWIPSHITKHTTILAKWTPNNNSVVFEANGGTGTMQPLVIPTDSKAKLTKNAFSRDGYFFVGWSSTADGEVEYENLSQYHMGTKKINTLYAVWDTVKYTINYELEGGTQNENNPTYYTVEKVEELLAPTRPGYDFTGWRYEGEELTSTDGLAKEITVVATWQLERHTIRYIGVEPDEHNNPTDFDAEDEFDFAEPVRTGYSFKGWFVDADFENSITGISLNTVVDVEVYAKFVINTYSIEYKLDTDVTNNPNNITEFDVTTSFTLLDPSFEKAGYEFDGWYIENTTTKVTELVPGEYADSLTLVGKLKLIEYRIIYANDHGLEVPNGTKKTYTVKDAASTITIPNLSKKGYTFHGWYSEDTYENKITQITIDPDNPKDIFVYAKITLDTYTITYNFGGKTGVTNPNATTYDVLTNVVFAEATCGEYSTIGWYTDSSFKNKIESTAGRTGNFTVYARWATSDNQPIILLPPDYIDSIYANTGNGRGDNGYALFDGEKTTTGIYSDGNVEWFGKQEDVLTIEFKNEVEIFSVYAYCVGNYTFSEFSFYDASGNIVKKANLLAENSGTSTQVKMFEVATAIKVKKIEIKITSLKWESPRTHKISELEIFIANPNYIPE